MFLSAQNKNFIKITSLDVDGETELNVLIDVADTETLNLSIIHRLNFDKYIFKRET